MPFGLCCYRVSGEQVRLPGFGSVRALRARFGACSRSGAEGKWPCLEGGLGDVRPGLKVRPPWGPTEADRRPFSAYAWHPAVPPERARPRTRQRSASKAQGPSARSRPAARPYRQSKLACAGLEVESIGQAHDVGVRIVTEAVLEIVEGVQPVFTDIEARASRQTHRV